MSSNPFLFSQDLLNRYVMTGCMIIGNIGNIFNVFIFRKHHKNPCSMYLLSASIMNVFFLTFIISFSVHIYNFGDPTVQYPVFCKLRTYLPHVWGQMGRYFIVLASIDRFVITNTNVRLRALSRPSLAKWFLIAFTIIWHVFGSLALIFTKVENGICSQFGNELAWYNAYSISTIGIIPLLLTTIFGVLAHRNMKQLRTRIVPLGNVLNVGLHRRDRELLKMVIAEALVHFLTNFLYPIIIIEIVATSYMNSDKSALRIQIENFILLIARILFYTSNAAPFYIFYTASKSFRHEFKETFRKCKQQTVGVRKTVEGLQMAQ